MNFKNILEKKNDINGFIFYRLEMFLDHKRSINYDLIRKTLKKGYEIHFIRQNISIRSFITIGERPKKGSSIIKSLGRPIMPLAIASICCSPPDIVRAS